MTKDQVLQMTTIADPSRSFVIDLGSKDTKLEQDGEMVLTHKGKTHKMSELAKQSLIVSAGLPKGLSKALQSYPDLLVHNVAYMAKKRNLALRVYTRGRNVLAITDPNLMTIPNERIIETIDKRVDDVAFDQVYETPKGVFNFHAFTQGDVENPMQIVPGDIFKYGVRVSNSPYGIRRPAVSGYLVRGICLNGAVSVDDVWTAPYKDDPEWLDASIRSARKVSRGFFKKIKALSDITIDPDHIDEMLESIYGNLQVPQGVREFVSGRVIKEGATTMYDIFNHMTYVGSHYRAVQDHPSFIIRLMQAGGALTNHASSCGSCYQILRS